MSTADTTKMSNLTGVSTENANELESLFGYQTAEALAHGYLLNNAGGIESIVNNTDGLHNYIATADITNEELGYPDAENPVADVMQFIRVFGLKISGTNENVSPAHIQNTEYNPFSPDSEVEEDVEDCVKRWEITADEIDFSQNLYRDDFNRVQLTFTTEERGFNGAVATPDTVSKGLTYEFEVNDRVDQYSRDRIHEVERFFGWDVSNNLNRVTMHQEKPYPWPAAFNDPERTATIFLAPYIVEDE